MTKLTTLLLFPALCAVAMAQTTTRPAVRHTPVHHAAAAAASTTKVCSDTDIPALSAKIPVVQGCPKPLYALKYVDTVVGTGPLAEPKKWYTVHYTGYLPDGTKFDSSVDRGEPITFPYGAHQVISGWDTGFEGMHTGGKRRLFIPYQLAYGEAGRPPTIPVKAELVFDVELVSFSDTAPAPKTPPAAPAKPADTTKPADPASAPAGKPTDPTKPTAVDPAAKPTAPTTTTPKQ